VPWYLNKHQHVTFKWQEVTGRAEEMSELGFFIIKISSPITVISRILKWRVGEGM
jgi:hypothetical protein